MIARQPYLPRLVAGGPGNPLGARAMYLGGTEYRIHGTNEPATIGKHVSCGCIRLTNEDVIDLYNRVTGRHQGRRAAADAVARSVAHARSGDAVICAAAAQPGAADLEPDSPLRPLLTLFAETSRTGPALAPGHFLCLVHACRVAG